MRKRGAVIAQPAVVTGHVLRGPEPIGAAAADGLDLAYGVGMEGLAQHSVIGMATYGVDRFSGDCGPLQNWGHGPFLGQNPNNVLGSLGAGQIPATASTVTDNSVLSAMLTNGDRP